MAPIRTNQNRTYRRVFHKPNRRPASIIRLSIESFSMTLVGSSIIFFLDSLEDRMRYFMKLPILFTDIFNGVRQIFLSLIGVSSSLLIVILLMLSLILLTGGIWRFLKLIALLKTNIRKKY